MSRCLIAFLNDLPTSEKQKLDLIFRLSFLEGVARKDAGEWVRKPAQGALQARMFFESQKIPMDKSWFGPLPGTPWVVELDRRAYGMVKRFEKGLLTINVAQEDITNELVAATNSPTGRRQDKVFYSFGLSWKDPTELRNTPPIAKDVIGPGLTRALTQFIKDAIARKGNRPQMMQQIDQLTGDRPDTSRSEETLLIDLMGEQLGVGNAILNLAEPAIDRVTKDEVGRFALKRFFTYMTDPSYNVYEPGPGRDKRPNRSKMWAMMSRIRDKVREDMLEHFDPEGTKSEDEREKFLRRLYRIIGTASHGSEGNVGLPKGIEKVLAEVRKLPSVEKLIERFQQERARLDLHSMTASVVKAFQVRKARQSLGLLGVLLEVPPDQWA